HSSCERARSCLIAMAARWRPAALPGFSEVWADADAQPAKTATSSAMAVTGVMGFMTASLVVSRENSSGLFGRMRRRAILVAIRQPECQRQYVAFERWCRVLRSRIRAGSASRSANIAVFVNLLLIVGAAGRSGRRRRRGRERLSIDVTPFPAERQMLGAVSSAEASLPGELGRSKGQVDRPEGDYCRAAP